MRSHITSTKQRSVHRCLPIDVWIWELIHVPKSVGG